MNKTFTLKYGKQKMSISLPTDKILYDIKGNDCESISDLPAALLHAIKNPIDSKPLQEIVKPGEKVVIIVSDVTRAWIKSDKFLPTILNELNTYGIPDSDISIIIALGTHRCHTPEEDVLVCGQEVVDRVKIYQHDGLDESQLVQLGSTSFGTPIIINKLVHEADRIILTGGITFHLMAGYGGGRKSIIPGVSGDAAIQGNHSIAMHPEVGKGVNPLCESGKTGGNPLNEDMLEACNIVKPDFLINFAYDANGDFAKIVAGHWHTAWQEGCKFVNQIFGIPIAQKAELVIATAGGFPKDINLYQGCKMIDNAMMACKEGGSMIFLLECPDIKEPAAFSDWLRYTDVLEFEKAVRADFSIPAFIAFKLFYTAQEYNCVLVTKPENFEIAKRVGMQPAATLDEAFALVQDKLPKDYKVTIMSQGANTVPIMKK